MNIDNTNDVFNWLNNRRGQSLRVSNRIVIEWPYLKTPPQPHDRISAGELGTAVVTTVETMFFPTGNLVLVELHIVPDASYFDAPKTTKKPAKKKKMRRAE